MSVPPSHTSLSTGEFPTRLEWTIPACGACLGGGNIHLRCSFADKICSMKHFLIFDILESARRTNACVTVVIASWPPGSRNRRPSAACWVRVSGAPLTARPDSTMLAVAWKDAIMYPTRKPPTSTGTPLIPAFL